MATAAYAGVRYYCRRKTTSLPSKAAVDQALRRLEHIYLKRRQALMELIVDMEDDLILANVDHGETQEADLKMDKDAAYDSVEDIDRAIALLLELQQKGAKGNIDVDELLEQVQWAEEAQDLWMQAIRDVRARWLGET